MTVKAKKVTKHEVHHPSELNLFHKNPRLGDVDAIAASLRANNQYKPITVNRGTHTGRPLEVLAGNHTVKAFRDLAEKYPEDERWQEVDCWVIDVDDDRATRIVAADNRTAEKGSFDDEMLLELLSSLDDLEGTAYEQDDLDQLERLIAEAGVGTETDEHDDSQGGTGEEEDDGRAANTGDMLAIIDVSVAEPKHQPEHGSVWKLGRHVLVVARLAEEHQQWVKYLEPDMMFAPYPEPFLSTSDKALEKRILFVQPNKYLAGHLLDKHESAFPEEEVVQL